MKIVIFAGGSGKRFWPISREKNPKQFQQIIDDKSTFQIHVENHQKMFGWANLSIATTEALSTTVKDLFPEMPLHNIITEPTRRDLGPAVGLVMLRLAKMNKGHEPTVIVWSDSVIGNTKNYFDALQLADDMLTADKNQLIYIGEKPKYANENLGWLALGKEVATQNGFKVYEQGGFQYRPPLAQAKKWFAEKTHLWNTGYFVTTPDFVLSEYKRQQPKMYAQLMEINDSLNTDEEYETLEKVYPQMESISFDNAILEGMPRSQSKIISGDFNWADPGTLYALKQFLQKNPDANVIKGKAFDYETKDSLIYNFVDKQLVTTVGLEGFVVINTPDALFISHKDQIPKIKDMLKDMADKGYKQYL